MLGFLDLGWGTGGQHWLELKTKQKHSNRNIRAGKKAIEEDSTQENPKPGPFPTLK